jgi:hypothetical protein
LEKQCVATFNATHYALRAEKVCKKERYAVKLVPVPRQFSSNCGLALQFDCPEKESLLKLFEEKKVKIHAVHELD